MTTRAVPSGEGSRAGFDSPTVHDRFSSPIQYRKGTEMQNEDQFLRRADGSIYGVKDAHNGTPAEKARESWENLAKLPYPVYDGTGCRYLALGEQTYGLIDWDGKYRLGLYFTNDDEPDDGGICAEFELFGDLVAFARRLSRVHAPAPEEWEIDGDPCNDCGQPAAYNEANGWYYHIDPAAPACFLMGSGRDENTGSLQRLLPGRDETRRITESEGPYADTQEAHDRFLAALKEFYSAGMKLVAAWDDPDVEFHADEIWPLPERLTPPLSLDEWLTELLAHYEEEN